MKKYLNLIIAIFILLSVGFSQESNETNKIKAPKLNGHYFSSIDYMRSSFITTNVEANLGYGQTSKIKIPGITIG